MPIAFDGQIYEDEYNLEQGRPVELKQGTDKDFSEPRTVVNISQATPVPPEDLNASAGSVEAPRPLPDTYIGESGQQVEDRRHIPYADVSWQGFHELNNDYKKAFKSLLLGDPLPDEVPSSPLGEAAGLSDVKLENKIDPALIDRIGDEVFRGWKLAKGIGNAAVDLYNGKEIQPMSQGEDRKGWSEIPFSAGSVIGNRLTGNGGEKRYQTWPEKMVRAGLGGLALPGKVSQGLIAPDSVQAIEQAADLAGFAVLGPAPVAKGLVDGTLGSFAGVKSKALNKTKLYEANEMFLNKADPEDIYTATGFFRGADDRWRYEIPDKDARLKLENLNYKAPTKGEGWNSTGGNESVSVKSKVDPSSLSGNMTMREMADIMDKSRTTLGDVYEHPELFKAYPFLKDVSISEVPPEWKTMASAYYDPSNNTIALSPQPGDVFKTNLAHEIQHAIQTHEGFARGGNQTMFNQPGLKGAEKLLTEAKRDTIKTAVTKGIPASETGIIRAAIENEILYKRPVPPDTMFGRAVQKAKEKGVYEDFEKIVRGEILLKEKEAERILLYRRLAGEVESRNVEARIMYDELDRILHSPMKSQEFPNSEQAISFR